MHSLFAVIKQNKRLGSIFFNFWYNNIPLILGIFKSRRTKSYTFLLNEYKASIGSVKASTINPSYSKNDLNKLVISLSSSIINILLPFMEYIFTFISESVLFFIKIRDNY
jgi:hypothetical protein